MSSKIKKMITNAMIDLGQWLIHVGCKLAAKNNRKTAAFGEF